MTLIAFLFCVVVGKLFYVQLVDGQKLSAKALDQWTRDLPLVARRGGVYDRNGILLAGTNTSYSLYARPVEVEDAPSIAECVSEVLGLAYEKVLAKVSKSGVSEVTVAKKMTKEQMLAIQEKGLAGLYFSRDIARYYPYGDLMCQLLGFTNVDTYGQTGVELYYDTYLRGVDGCQLTPTDIRGVHLDESTHYLPSIDGMNVLLTVDKSIQFFAESACAAAMEKHGAKGVSCLVMDAVDGGILALAQSPGFDLNAVPRDDVETLFANSKISAVSNVYEMGSTFKILTMAIALNEGKVTLNDRFYCAGSREVDGQKIKCWRAKGHGSQSFAEAVQNSCNCAFMDLALRVGVDTMYEYFRRFGLTSTSGVDIAGETSGLLLAQESVKNVDLARIGFGQAVAVTPLALVRAVSACVNGGILLTPHILKGVYDPSGAPVQNGYGGGVRVLREETSATLRELLLGVVAEGSGRLAGVEGYQIGGKTGTAQKYGEGGIARGKYLSSFIGFLSYDNPRYVVLFYVDEPQGYLYYGSQVAAPYVGEIFANLLSYLGEEPATREDKQEIVMPDWVGKSYAEVEKEARKLGLYLETSGEGEVVTYQFPVAGTVCTLPCVAYVDLP